MKTKRLVLKLVNPFVMVFILTSVQQSFSQIVPILEWAKAIGGIPYNAGDGIALDAAGNVYTTGTFYGTADFDPGPGTFNMTAPSSSNDGIFISKLSSTGDFVWAKSINSNYNGAYGIAVDDSGNVLITGFYQAGDIVDFDPGPGIFNLTSTGNYDTYILKLDTNGDFVWAKRIGGIGTSYTQVFGNGIALDNSGNLYITGEFVGTIDFDPSAVVYNLVSTVNRDIFICKIDANGNFVWAKAMAGFKGCACDDAGSSVAVDGSGNVYTTGFLRVTADFDPGPGTFNVSPSSGGGVFVSKLDTNGDFVWAKGLGGNGSQGIDISLDAAGNVYTTGYAYGTSDFDPGAGTFNLISAGSIDFFVSKLDNNGNFAWAKSFGNIAGDLGQGIDVDDFGNVYINGEFNYTVDFDPGPNTFNLTGNYSYFIQKLDTNGDFVWARSIGTQGNGSSIIVESSTIYAFGSLTSTTADFDPGACFFNPTSISSGSIFIQKLQQGTPVPGPTIASFTPTIGPIGTSVTITGTNFSPIPTENVAKFFNNKTATVTASTPISITVTVPSGTTTGKISVTTNCLTVTSTTDFTIGTSTFPTITSFTPTSGLIGTTVTITGTNFSTTPANNTVKFNGTTAVATASTATSITTTVPTGATTGKISVTIGGNTATSATDFTVNIPLPTITSFTPTSGPVGTTVTITGTNFNTTPANNTLKFNGTTAIVTASTGTSITTTVPLGATTGTITVTVAGNTATSATNFTVTSSPIITITTQPSDFIACIGQTATFTCAATGTTNIIYQWQYSPDGIVTFVDIINGGGYFNSNTSVLSINTAGTFGEGRYQCRINGDFASEVLSFDEGLFINPIPSAPTSTNVTNCGSASVTLTASGGINGQYRWYTVAVGGTALSGEVNSNYTTPLLTASVVYYVAINNGTCESVRTSVMAIVGNVAKPIIVTSNCTATSATLTGPAGFTTYAWSNGGSTQQITVSTGGSYTLTVTDVNGCVSVPSNAVTFNTDFCNQTPVITTTPISTTVEGSVTISLSALISDPDNNLDLSTLKVTKLPTSGASATINANSQLMLDYSGKLFSGSDELTVEVCDLSGKCVQQILKVEVIGDIIIYNGISPNGDGLNDAWIIQYIEVIAETKDNKVSVFNRWGDVVFETQNYDNKDRVFKGVNKNGNEVSSGTYFYKIAFSNGRKTQTGYLSLKR